MSIEPRRVCVGRRRIVYVPGYDPRPPRTYASLFEAELGKFAELHGISCSVQRRRCRLVEGTNGVVLSVTAQWSDGPVDSELHILDWHDIALADFALGYMRRLQDSLVVLWLSLVHGVFAHIARLNWSSRCSACILGSCSSPMRRRLASARPWPSRWPERSCCRGRSRWSPQ